MELVRQLGSLVSVALVLLAPAIASACPVCAARGDGGIGTTLLIGSMVVLPFTVAGSVIWAIKRNQQLEEEPRA